MKITLNGNIYEVSLQQTLDIFGEYLRGAEGGLIAALGTTWPDDASHTAIENSLAALGYGSGTCTYVATSSEKSTEANAPEPELDPSALFALVEGLDPVCLIVLDRQTATQLGAAYRQEIPLDCPLRLHGRDVVAFDNFSAMMRTSESKQRAWAILKALPRIQ